MFTTITPQELQQRLQQSDELILLDVREADEYAICHLAGSLHIPLAEVTKRLAELDPAREIVTICHHGIRSAHAAGLLAVNDYQRVYNLRGGLAAWAETIDPAMPRY